MFLTSFKTSEIGCCSQVMLQRYELILLCAVWTEFLTHGSQTEMLRGRFYPSCVLTNTQSQAGTEKMDPNASDRRQEMQ